MDLSEELKHWGYHSSISDEGKKQHLEMAERAEKLEADNAALQKALKYCQGDKEVMQNEIDVLKRQVEGLFAAWYECPEDSVPDILQDVFVELEAGGE